MEVCYAYSGIGQVIVEMTPSDWAAWAGALGTLAAAWLAVSLYSRSRRDAKADGRARRNVLDAMLREHVVGTARFIRESRARISTPSFETIELPLRMRMLELENADRLFDLQLKLLDFGEQGDAEIAAFIEACRTYHKTQQDWKRQADSGDLSFWDTPEGDRESLVITAVRGALTSVDTTVEPALAAIEHSGKR
jgi:hypothetical protein